MATTQTTNNWAMLHGMHVELRQFKHKKHIATFACSDKAYAEDTIKRMRLDMTNAGSTYEVHTIQLTRLRGTTFLRLGTMIGEGGYIVGAYINFNEAYKWAG